jgi:hypothetical protein
MKRRKIEPRLSLQNADSNVLLCIFRFVISRVSDIVVLLTVQKTWQAALVSRAVRGNEFVVVSKKVKRGHYLSLAHLYYDWTRLTPIWKSAFRIVRFTGSRRKMSELVKSIIQSGLQMVEVSLEIQELSRITKKLPLHKLQTKKLSWNGANRESITLHECVQHLKLEEMPTCLKSCPNVQNLSLRLVNDHSELVSFRAEHMFPNVKALKLRGGPPHNFKLYFGLLRSVEVLRVASWDDQQLALCMLVYFALHRTPLPLRELKCSVHFMSALTTALPDFFKFEVHTKVYDNIIEEVIGSHVQILRIKNLNHLDMPEPRALARFKSLKQVRTDFSNENFAKSMAQFCPGVHVVLSLHS